MMKPGLTGRDYLLPKVIRDNLYNKNLIYGLDKKVPKNLLYKKKEGKIKILLTPSTHKLGDE